MTKDFDMRGHIWAEHGSPVKEWWIQVLSCWKAPLQDVHFCNIFCGIQFENTNAQTPSSLLPLVKQLFGMYNKFPGFILFISLLDLDQLECFLWTLSLYNHTSPLQHWDKFLDLLCEILIEANTLDFHQCVVLHASWMDWFIAVTNIQLDTKKRWVRVSLFVYFLTVTFLTKQNATDH